jgi:hypothetical protein
MSYIRTHENSIAGGWLIRVCCLLPGTPYVLLFFRFKTLLSGGSAVCIKTVVAIWSAALQKGDHQQKQEEHLYGSVNSGNIHVGLDYSCM